jgi:hypothetical protein
VQYAAVIFSHNTKACMPAMRQSLRHDGGVAVAPATVG